MQLRAAINATYMLVKKEKEINFVSAIYYDTAEY